MLQAGTRVGPYEIVSWLGAGGMGEVYRARDTKLDREVALKTLPGELAGQPERLARLRHEARILASLNHPGIAALHGLEESDGGVPVLVMELVEGESLADRLRRGRLPLREAVTVAHQIAIALEAAHEKSVLHRDLKPGNIRLALDGRVKMLDFGLAKAVRKAVVDSRLDTDTSPHSEPGTVLGTAPYMSPEQARGQDADHRSDVWAFGCVLFEMLTGKRAFAGASFSDTVAAVLDREPDWKALPPETPPALVRLLRRCLQKEKDKRLRDVGDARLDLEDFLSTTSTTGRGENEIAVSVSGSPIAWWGLTRSRLLWLMLGVAAAGVGVWALGTSTLGARPAVVRWAIPVSPTDNVQQVTLSPDVTHLAYVALRDGHSQIYVRALNRFDARPIPGTEDGDAPFFSPDGRWLGFTVDGKLKKVPLSGGAPFTLCDAGTLFAATWDSDDTVVFTSTEGSGLLRVSADGGAPQALTTLDPSRHERSHRFPEALPGGAGIVFTVKPDDALSWDDARIEAISLRTGQRSLLIAGGACAHYLAPGHLIYHRMGSLWSAPFDPVRLKVTGPPVLVLDGVSSSGIWGYADFSISQDGSLVYVPGRQRENDRRLVRVDRAGRRQPLTDVRRGFRHLNLSPDGRRLALEIAAPNDHVWVYDLDRATLTLLTIGGDSGSAIWTPDGRRVTFTSDRETPWHLFWQPADGSGPAERLSTHAHPEGQFPLSWSPDGKTLLFGDGQGIWTLQPDGDREPAPVLDGPEAPYSARLSPNGRWFAYVSRESGRDEVYVRPFPGSGSRWTISTDGGSEPAWATNGRELFYRNGDRMMAVTVTTDAAFSVSKPRMLFAARTTPDVFRSYDVTPEGEFLMIEPGESDTPPLQINVVLNWLQEVRLHVAGK